jgi:hypothetical protein
MEEVFEKEALGEPVSKRLKVTIEEDKNEI